MKITIRIDRKAALLEGRELGETAEIEITKEQAGDLWPAIVAALDMSQTPPALRSGHFPPVSDATAEALIEGARAAKAAADAEEIAWMSDYRAAVEQYILERSGELAPEVKRHESVEYQGWKLPSANWPSTWGVSFSTADRQAEFQALGARADAAESEANARLLAANEAALAEAMPAITAELEKRAAAKAAADEAAKAEKLAKFAARLESGIYERETSVYNEKRYGKPWIAAVSLDGNKLAYDFHAGTATASYGSSGMLSIPCVPGDIIAWGQKDLRRPDKSNHNLLQMRADGGMDTIDRTDAVRALRAAK